MSKKVKASKLCSQLGHDWGKPKGPVCIRCGRIHRKRGKHILDARKKAEVGA